jgi:hypothetical protein
VAPTDSRTLRQRRADEPPQALHEADDMLTVEPPCHPFERIKVTRDRTEALHFLVCRQRIALG